MMNLNVKTEEERGYVPSGVIKLLHVREQTTDWLIGNCKEHKKTESHLSAAAAIACCQFEDGKDGELWGKKWIHAREVNHQLSQGFPPRICAVYLRLNFQDPPKYQLTLQSWLFSWMIDLLCIKTLSELRAEVKQHFCFFQSFFSKSFIHYGIEAFSYLVTVLFFWGDLTWATHFSTSWRF